MKLMKNSESGQALVLALILLALGALLVVPTLNLTSTSARYHQLIGSKTLESYSADSGMEYALCKLYNAPGAYTDPANPLDETFNLNGRTVSITANYTGGGLYKLTSTATSADGKSTTIEANVNLSAGVFIYAIASKSSLDISGTGYVESTPEPMNGDIWSSGNITITGGFIVYGDARAVGTISAPEGAIKGDSVPDQNPIAFPGDYTQLYKAMAQETGNIWDEGDTLTLPTGPQELGPIYIQGNLRVPPSAVVTLTGTVYVTGWLTVEGGGRFQGEQNIAVEGDITFNGGSFRSQQIPMLTANPGDIRIVAAGTKKIVNAVIYAPYSSVELVGVHLYGAVGGAEVDLSNTTVTWSATLNGREDLPGGELKTISYSYK